MLQINRCCLSVFYKPNVTSVTYTADIRCSGGVNLLIIRKGCLLWWSFRKMFSMHSRTVSWVSSYDHGILHPELRYRPPTKCLILESSSETMMKSLETRKQTWWKTYKLRNFEMDNVRKFGHFWTMQTKIRKLEKLDKIEKIRQN